MSTNAYDRVDGDETSAKPPDNPTPLTALTGFQRDVLFVIARTQHTHPNGVTIREHLETHYEKSINTGRLYQNLRSLVDDGLVATRPLDGRTNAYHLAGSARERLEASRDWETECLRDSDLK